MRKINVGVACLLAAALLASCAAPSKPQPGGRAADFTLKECDGTTRKLSDYSGRVVLVVFWATWCPPCKQEVPSLIRLQSKYGEKGLTVIGISLDARPENVVPRFIADSGINYLILCGNDQVVKDYGNFTGIPAGFLIDRQGKIAQRYMGYTLESKLSRDIEGLL